MKTIEYRLKTQFKRKYLNSLNVNFKPTLVLLLFFLSKQAKKKILNPKFCVCFFSQSKRREKIESKFTECRSCPFTSFIHRLKKRNSLSCEMLTFSKNKMCLFIILLWKHFALHCQLYQSIVKFWKKKKKWWNKPFSAQHFSFFVNFLWIILSRLAKQKCERAKSLACNVWKVQINDFYRAKFNDMIIFHFGTKYFI